MTGTLSDTPNGTTTNTMTPPMTEPLIRATGLGIRRGGRWLIRDVSLSLAPGEAVTIVGPNGGGKSTLVKTLVGLFRPDAGTVTRQRRLSIGYMPQRLALDSTLPLPVHRLMTLTRRYPRAQVEAALARTGVAKLYAAPVTTLSGGELQRVLLARTILARPQVLVLDEPVQGVDYAGEASLYRLIGDLKTELACGVLMVSHDLHLVMARTDRVICLNGHVCCSGTPAHVTSNAEFQRLFGPRAADVYRVYHHQHDHSHEPDGGLHLVHSQPHDAA